MIIQTIIVVLSIISPRQYYIPIIYCKSRLLFNWIRFVIILLQRWQLFFWFISSVEAIKKSGISTTLFFIIGELSAHYLWDSIEDFIVTATASCWTVGDFLYFLEVFLQVLKLIKFIQCIFNIEEAYLFTVTDYIVKHCWILLIYCFL